MSDAKSKAGKAITQLSGKAASRRSFGEARDQIKSVRRGGHIRDLNGTVHN